MDSWISWPPPFGHPIFATAPIVMPLVFKFYDSMSGFTCPASHVMGKARAERKFPQLASENAKYYSVFYEGQVSSYNFLFLFQEFTILIHIYTA